MRKTHERTGQRTLGVVAVLVALWAQSAAATMLYHMPFQDGAGASSLTNLGSKAGTATTVANPYDAGNVCVATNDTPWNSPNTYAYDFPLSDSHGDFGPQAVLPDSTNEVSVNTAGDALTLSAWIKWHGEDTHTGDHQGIVSKLPSSENAGWALALESSGRTLQFTLGGVANVFSVSAVPSNVWTHVACAYTVGGGLYTYVGGTNDGLRGLTGSTGSDDFTAIHLGTYKISQRRPLNGTLDDVAIWDTALSAGKILALASAPAVLPAHDASAMNTLFELYDGADPNAEASVHGLIWRYTSSLPAGHSEGDTWADSGGHYIQFAADGSGVQHVFAGTVVSIR